MIEPTLPNISRSHLVMKLIDVLMRENEIEAVLAASRKNIGKRKRKEIVELIDVEIKRFPLVFRYRGAA